MMSTNAAVVGLSASTCTVFGVSSLVNWRAFSAIRATLAVPATRVSRDRALPPVDACADTSQPLAGQRLGGVGPDRGVAKRKDEMRADAFSIPG